MNKSQVIVAGAGPVGMVAAYRLASAGIRVTVLEAEDHCKEDLRASTIHPPTLDMFEQLGIVESLIDQGIKTPIYHFRERESGDYIAFDFSELADVTDYPYRLQCEQYKISRLLAKRLSDEFSMPVQFSNRIRSVQQSADGVTVETSSPDGDRCYSADYLIGADGGSSVIRKSLQVPFLGSTYAEKFLTFSTGTRLEHYFDNFAGVNYVADEEEWASIILTPSGWRVLVPADGEVSDGELTSDAYKDRVFGSLLGPDEPVETHHRTVYRVHQRVAEKYNHGRIALAGDSAHVHNPLGGFGMNSGIHDAWNVTDKLIDIINEGRDHDDAFAHYNRQRRTIMSDFIQTQSALNKAYMEVGSREAHRKQQEKLLKIADNDELRRDYLLRQSMISSRAEEAAIL